jgi:hypothetical protein
VYFAAFGSDRGLWTTSNSRLIPDRAHERSLNTHIRKLNSVLKRANFVATDLPDHDNNPNVEQ